jgi:indolepyruvate ferredoxin oxidoreductase
VISLPLDDVRLSKSLDERIARRVEFLTDYQNADYARQYSELVAKVRAAEERAAPTSTALTEAVTRYAFKLMSYKDEYEVARLQTAEVFRRQIEATFEGNYTIKHHLAPPLFSKKDADGHLVKSEYGAWIRPAFGLLAKLKFLRGTAFDIFGYTQERKTERQLIVDYRAQIDELLAGLNADNASLAAEIASVPEHIRGYGHVKEAHLAKATAMREALFSRWRTPVQERAAA